MAELSSDQQPTATRTPATSPSAAEPPATSDFHLVESTTGWTLTINLTSGGLGALLARGDASGPTASLSVHVEPNLLPGHPFMAKVVVANPSGHEA